MALCSLCRAIPFNSLPDPRVQREAPSSMTYDSDGEIHTLSCDLPHDHESNNLLGHPWHSDLKSLEASAASCALCSTVHQGYRAWLVHFEALQQDPNYIKDYDGSVSIPDGQRLWLTGRLGRGPGFAVWVNHEGLSEVYFLAGISLAVYRDNAAAQKIPIRPQDQFSGSDYSLDQATSLLRRCCEEHPRCRKEETLLPTRVVDIGGSQEILRLIEPTGQSGQYACLSYCWGADAGFTTRRATINAMRLGFPVSNMPQTLRDAVKVVRHIGLRYLWIDCLCICQDDRDDWARESARMHAVYSNAHLVIAANRAAHARDGIFHIRPARPSCTIDIPGLATDVHVQLLDNTNEIRGSGWTMFSREPLSQRCWALQERVLARRILHFNSRKIYFECDSGIFGEDGCYDNNRFAKMPRSWLYSEAEDEMDVRDNFHERWKRLIRAYMERHLTHKTDKLPGMSGLAGLFATKTRTQYVAGVWSDALVVGMLWNSGGRACGPASRERYIAPSWSWASYGGCAGIVGDNWDPVAEVIEWHVQPLSEANPYGELASAYVRLRAPLVSVSPFDGEFDIEKCDSYIEPAIWRAVKGANGDVYAAYFDDKEIADSGEWETWETYVMILAFDNQYDEDTKQRDHFGFLLVEENDPSARTMKRIGWLSIPLEEADRIIQDEQNWAAIDLV